MKSEMTDLIMILIWSGTMWMVGFLAGRKSEREASE